MRSPPSAFRRSSDAASSRISEEVTETESVRLNVTGNRLVYHFGLRSLSWLDDAVFYKVFWTRCSPNLPPRADAPCCSRQTAGAHQKNHNLRVEPLEEGDFCRFAHVCR